MSQLLALFWTCNALTVTRDSVGVRVEVEPHEREAYEQFVEHPSHIEGHSSFEQFFKNVNPSKAQLLITIGQTNKEEEDSYPMGLQQVINKHF